MHELVESELTFTVLLAVSCNADGRVDVGDLSADQWGWMVRTEGAS